MIFLAEALEIIKELHSSAGWEDGETCKFGRFEKLDQENYNVLRLAV